MWMQTKRKKELWNKIDELLEQNAKTAPLYLEASQNWENFKDWLVEDIFQRTYQDVITDRRMPLHCIRIARTHRSGCAALWFRMQRKKKAVEPTLQPLPLDAVNEYNALKERYPDALVGYEQYGNFEFYGEDAKARFRTSWQQAVGKGNRTRQGGGIWFSA